MEHVTVSSAEQQQTQCVSGLGSNHISRIVKAGMQAHARPAAAEQHSSGCSSFECVLDIQVVDDWSAQSYRVLAVALAEVRHVNKLKLASMSQQDVEQHAGQLKLLGLIILSNHVNPDSKETVQQLQERWVAAHSTKL